MKEKILIRLLVILIMVSCTHEPISYQESQDFTVTDAKSYFEENANDLRNVSFNPEVLSRSFTSDNITPNWKKAVIARTGNVSTVEVPLDGDVSKVAKTFKMNSAKILFGFATKVTTKLVVQRHVESGTCRQFVVTFIDGPSHSLRNDETRNYCDKNKFSGYIIISAVTGEYLESYRSVNGCWKRVYMAPGTKKELEDTRIACIQLLGADVSASSYDFGEGGNDICSECGNIESMCTCCKKCNGIGCSECTVLVHPTCPRCNYTGPNANNGSCYCCSQCHNYPCTCRNVCIFCNTYPCVCELYACPYCGNRYCNGSCQYPKPDPEEPDKCYHKQCPVCHKMIRTQTISLTRSSICDNHEYCENNGMCVDVQVVVSKNLITLGDTYTVSLKLTPSNTVCTYTAFHFEKDGVDFPITKEGHPTSVNVMARTPGIYQIKAEIQSDKMTTLFYSKRNATVTQIFPDRNEILKQQVVIDGMNNSWAQTLAAADATGMQEFGGYVVIDTRETNTGNLYRYENCQGLKTPYSASEVKIDLIDINNNDGPNRGGEFTVLFFHAHPPYWGYKGSKYYSRKVGPSKIDSTNHTTVPAVVKDFWSADSMIDTRMARSAYENTGRLYHYGIERKQH